MKISRPQFLGGLLAAATMPVAPASADSPQTPTQAPSATKTNPPPGIAVPDDVRTELAEGAGQLGEDIDSLKESLKGKAELLRYLPDVEIFHKAVQWALDLNEFYNAREFATARELLKEGRARAAALKSGQTPWLHPADTTRPVPVPLGYRSKIDGSVQPYGIIFPAGWKADDKTPRRLELFWHGRGDTLTELAFVGQRQHSLGDFTPPGAFVLHPYGRFCNANRFAGEVDTFEAIDDLKSRFPIDENRIVARGFSMGGAACWTYATHHADFWVAASPGAGFAETPDYTRAFAAGAAPIPWYVQRLWHLYDATDYALNLFNCPTVAYSGEIDPQKQSADKMEAAMKADGLTLARVIGPQTAHKYHPDSKKEISAFIDRAAEKGRDTKPRHIRFTTYTLRYNKMFWIEVGGLGKHWQRARIEAEWNGDTVTVKTENVTAFDVIGLGGAYKTIIVDGQKLRGANLSKLEDGTWIDTTTDNNPPSAIVTLYKLPGLQGPIDDAFMDSFVFVRPTGKPLNPTVGEWTRREMLRAAQLWKTFYRGEVRFVDDNAVTPDLAKRANLILWGDPQSNTVLRDALEKLPLLWSAAGIRFGDRNFPGGKTYPADRYAPAFIYPNPTAPYTRYLVVNSGFTFADYTAASNAQHAPKLPDWAILDMTVAGPLSTPGKVPDAGFFDENWKWKRAESKP